MDQTNLRNELVPVSAESQELPDNSRLSSETVSCKNEASQDNANLNIALHDSGNNTGHTELNRQVPESGLQSEMSNPSLTLCQQVSFPENSSGWSSTAFFSNNGDKQKVEECSMDNQKNIERDLGECSESQNSSNLNEAVNHVGEETNARISTVQRDGTFGHPSAFEARTSECFQRNTRRRISHADEANASELDLWSRYNNITHNPWPSQSSSAPVPPNQQYGQHHVRTVPAMSSELYPFQQSGISRMEVGTSSGSRTDVDDGAAAELQPLGVPINISGQVFVPLITTRNMIQDQTIWASANRNTVLFGNSLFTQQASTEFVVFPSQGANWLTYPNQHHRSEAACRSFFSSESEQRQRSMDLPAREHHRSSAVSRVQDPYTVLNMYRLNSYALGIPMIIFTPAAREGRNRMSAVEALRLRPASFGINLRDGYRDMRMDVDNMSYEELLALEERIGNVNTGLSDEKILNCLQQYKYVSTVSETSVEVEPCCICQEEFTEGEELGRLDCGHDFHSACIKQWLTIKNLCPMCKMTALSKMDD